MKCRYRIGDKIGISLSYIGYTSNKYEVIGFNIDKIDRLVIVLRCKDCGYINRYSINYDKIRILRCSHCSKVEVLVPMDIDTVNKKVNSFEIIGYSLYRKLYTDGIKNGIGKEGMANYIKNKIH